MDFPLAVLEYLNHEPIFEEQKLEGGMISLTRRLVTSKGSFVVKQCASPPLDLYQKEAEGLQALVVEGGPRVPEVLSVGDDHLLLEDLGKHEPGPGYWEEFGRRVALMHSVTRPHYGFNHDNYLDRKSVV